MPEADTEEVKNFFPDIPAATEGLSLKGAGSYDWGMRNRLARIFRPDTSRTVMLACDHGYFQGPTTGLERIDLNIAPLAPVADALMLTRGALRTSIPTTHRGGIVMRASGGPSIGKELTRDARYLGLATRICAELGAQFVKTYYCADGFETVTAGCPVPIVMAGGKKLPELEALEMAYRAIQEGAAGVDMGRNIFQSEAPAAMLQAVAEVVHEDAPPAEAYELFQDLSREKARA